MFHDLLRKSAPGRVKDKISNVFSNRVPDSDHRRIDFFVCLLYMFILNEYQAAVFNTYPTCG